MAVVAVARAPFLNTQRDAAHLTGQAILIENSAKSSMCGTVSLLWVSELVFLLVLRRILPSGPKARRASAVRRRNQPALDPSRPCAAERLRGDRRHPGSYLIPREA